MTAVIDSNPSPIKNPVRPVRRVRIAAVLPTKDLAWRQWISAPVKTYTEKLAAAITETIRLYIKSRARRRGANKVRKASIKFM
jgi:hypothetical protein